MSKMNYYSNELEDDFIEIDDTISSEEYHFSEVKEKKKEDKTPYYGDWCKNAVVMSCQPAVLYADSWRPINQSIDAQQCNDLRALANAYQTQQIITNPTDFIQQQLNTSCNNLGNGLRNLYETISTIMED